MRQSNPIFILLNVIAIGSSRLAKKLTIDGILCFFSTSSNIRASWKRGKTSMETNSSPSSSIIKETSFSYVFLFSCSSDVPSWIRLSFSFIIDICNRGIPSTWRSLRSCSKVDSSTRLQVGILGRLPFGNSSSS